MPKKINDVLAKAPKWLKYALPAFVILLIVLLAYYPGILVSDSMVQWHQTQTRIFSDWHPAYNTIYIFLLTLIWNNPFFVLLVQCFILSAALGLCFSKIEQYYKVNKIYLYMMSFIFALIPLNFNSAVILLKDTLYSSFILLLTAELISIVNDKDYIKEIKNAIKIGLILLIICLFRHNGILVVILTMLILIILYRKNKIVYVLSASVIVAYLLLTTVGFKILKIEGGNAANAYGPISHFMGKLLNNPNVKFTDEELKELSQYVDIEKLQSTFNQYNMDFSINAQNLEYIKEHKKEYLKFYLHKVIEYPKQFIAYYLKLDSFLYKIYPLEGQYTVGMFYETDLWIYKDIYPNLNENSKIPSLLNHLKRITINYQDGRLGIYTMRPAIYMYSSIIMIIILSILNKQKKLFIIILPAIFNIISLMPSIPVAMTRYVYSMHIVFYAIMTLFIYQILKKLVDYIILKNNKEHRIITQ